MVFLSHVKTKDIDVTIFLYMQAGFMVTTYTYYKCTTDHIDVYTQKKGMCVKLMGTHTIRKGRFCRK